MLLTYKLSWSNLIHSVGTDDNYIYTTDPHTSKLCLSPELQAEIRTCSVRMPVGLPKAIKLCLLQSEVLLF